MQLVVQSGSEPGRTYDIAASQKIRMGRQSGNDVVVPDEQVSRRHAEIEERNGGLVVTDLGSSNGTFVNGTRIASTQNLKAGDTVQVGTTVLKVVGSSTPAAPDYDQGATQMNSYTPAKQDYGSYGSPAAPSTPSTPATDYGQSAGGYGGSGSSNDQGQQNSYGGSSAGGSTPSYGAGAGQSSYGGSTPASSPSYDQGQSAYGGGSSAAAGSSYGGSTPASGSSYDQGQSAYGGAGQSSYGGGSSAGGSSYGGAAQSGSGSSYDPASPSAGSYGQPAAYGQSSTPSYGQSGASYDPATPSAAGATPYGSPAYDPANPSAGGYSAGQGAGGYDQNAYGQPGAYNQGQAAYGGGQQAYGQPGQPAQPGGQYSAYGQPGVPAVAAAKKGGLPVPLLIVGIVVVLIVVGALVFFLFLNKGGGAVGDISAPPNSTKIDVSAQDLAKLDPNSKVSQSDLSKVNFGIYTSTDSPSTIATFYQNDLKAKGWTQDTTKSTTSTISSDLQFAKGDQTATVSVIQIPDDATATAMGTAIPALSGKLKAGQTLVFAASGPTSIFNSSSGS